MSEPLETQVTATVLGGPEVRATVSAPSQVNATVGGGVIVNAPESGGIEVLVDPPPAMAIAAEAVGGVVVSATAEGGVGVVVGFGGSSGGASGTVTSVSVVTANGVSGSVANPNTTPAITLTLGAITPSSVNGVVFSGSGSIANSGVSSLTGFTGSGTASGTNTGDVTLAGENYLTIAGQVITANAVNLAGTNVTGILPNAKTTAASANTASAIVARDGSGNFSAGTITAALTGNASTATALATGRTISITGDLAYTSGSFDGTGNVTGAGTLASTGVSANSYGSSTAIPTFTVDAKGRLTAASTAAVIAPAGTVTGTTLASNVVTSSLTSVGTLTGGATGAGFTVALGTSTLTGDLPFANFVQSSAASKLVGRGSASGAGDFEEISLGTGLSMSGTTLSATGTGGTVTSVAVTVPGGFSVSGSPITTSGTIAISANGTSGGIPYYSGATTMASSAALAANALVIGGGAGATPSTTTTGTGVVTAIGNAVNTSGGFLTVGGGVYEVPLTFSTGLTRSTNTITVNTSQNISTLSNLTSNGLVTTSGGTGALSITAMATAATASAVAQRTSDADIKVNATIPNLTSTATATATTTLTSASSEIQVFTGTQSQIVLLPDAGTLSVGRPFTIINQSTLSVTVKSADTTALITLTPSTRTTVNCVTASGTGVSSWAMTPLGAGAGDVIGPATNTNLYVPTWNGANSKTLNNGLPTSSDPSTSGSNSAIVQYGLGGVVNVNAIDWYDSGTSAAASATSRICFVNFDGNTAANVSGTYARTSPSTTVTITLTAHGYIAGNVIYADFTTGTGVDGVYTVVSVVDANNFTITTAASTTTSGNVTLLRRSLTASSGIHSVTYQNTTGRFYVNLSTAMTDANYVAIGSATSSSSVFPAVAPGYSTAPTAQACEIASTAIGGALTNFTKIWAIFVR